MLPTAPVGGGADDNAGVMGVTSRVGCELRGAGTSELVVEGPYYRTQTALADRTYDIAPDGQPFLMIKEAEQTAEASAPGQIHVVLNWFEELNARVPTGR